MQETKQVYYYQLLGLEFPCGCEMCFKLVDPKVTGFRDTHGKAYGSKEN